MEIDAFPAICDRIKLITKTKTWTAVASELGVTRGYVSTLKSQAEAPGNNKDRQLPFKILLTWASKREVDFNWLLTGRGEPYRKEAKAPAAAQPSIRDEDSPPDLNGSEAKEVHPAQEMDPETADLLARAREVLEAGEDVYGSALRQNIMAFHKAVKGEQKERSGLIVAQTCICGRRIEHLATAIIEGDNVVACPSCGRMLEFDSDQVESIVEDLKAQIRQLREERARGRGAA